MQQRSLLWKFIRFSNHMTVKLSSFVKLPLARGSSSWDHAVCYNKPMRRFCTMAYDMHVAGSDLGGVDSNWIDAMTAITRPEGKRVLDIGCGEGLYTQAWAELGAAPVLGLDQSVEALERAARYSAGSLFPAAEAGSAESSLLAATEKGNHRTVHRSFRARSAPIAFRQADALATGLDDGAADIVFERALLHHVADARACVAEAHRLLASGGIYIVQDRTRADVQVAGSPEHIRGYIFMRFPQLLAVELPKRPTADAVKQLLQDAGFAQVRERTLWEIRNVYQTWEELAEDLRRHEGWWSILRELGATEEADLLAFIRARIPGQGSIVNKDRWTIWWAIKKE
jgi:ubiquinone/menaquinone biosynthesis C-methylase UbiE